MSNSHVTHEELKEVRGEILEAIAASREDITFRLDRMNGSIAKAHERITRNEVSIAGHQIEITRLRDKWNAAVDDLARKVQERCQATCTKITTALEDARPVSINTLKLLVGIVIATAVLTTSIILWVESHYTGGTP